MNVKYLCSVLLLVLLLFAGCGEQINESTTQTQPEQTAVTAPATPPVIEAPKKLTPAEEFGLTATLKSGTYHFDDRSNEFAKGSSPQAVYVGGKADFELCNTRDKPFTVSQLGRTELAPICNEKGSCTKLPLGVKIDFNPTDVADIKKNILESMSTSITLRPTHHDLKVPPSECLTETFTFRGELHNNELNPAYPTSAAFTGAKYSVVYGEEKWELERGADT